MAKSPESSAEIKQEIRDREIKVDSWEELHRQLSKMTDSGWVFRGVSSPEHYLIPSIGRESIYGPYKLAQEQRLFKEFKSRVVAIVNDPRLDDWHWLALAQHLGVPTRLLDWSISPLVATFFALEKDEQSDRVIYGLKYSTYIHEVDSRGTSDPFANQEVGRFSPPLLFDRIRAQRGVFTIHPTPTRLFFHHSLKVIRIPVSAIRAMRRKLFKYGMDYWQIYPDTEGLGLQMKWQYQNKIGLGSSFLDKK